MKSPSILCLVMLLGLACEKQDSNEIVKLSPLEVDLDCIERMGLGSSNIRIDSQAAFDSFYNETFTLPLQSWLDDNYEDLYDGVVKNYPNADVRNYDSILINDYVYNFAPFIFTKDCMRKNDIDFDKYTLLGISHGTAGCAFPERKPFICLDEYQRKLTYLLEVKIFGDCLPFFGFNDFILVDKIEDTYEVVFKIEETII